MKNFKCEDVINKIQWNQLRIAIRDDLPENALAGAFGDTIVLSKKLIQMVKNGLISKLSFLFIFLHAAFACWSDTLSANITVTVKFSFT